MFDRDLDAFAEEQAALVRLMRAASPADWDLPSGGCPGWSVGDVFLHLCLTVAQFADRRSLPPTDGLGTERANEVLVAHRRSWAHERVIEDYLVNGRAALDRMRAIGPDRVLPLGDLGTHPMSGLLRAYVWDHHTHLTCDVVAPDGPLALPGPPDEERLLEPAVGWILAALPQQLRDVPALDGSLRLDLEGPGARVAHVAVRDGRFEVYDEPPPGGGARVAAEVRSSTTGLLRWATQRRAWRDLTTVTGDADAAAPVLDVVRVF